MRIEVQGVGLRIEVQGAGLRILRTRAEVDEPWEGAPDGAKAA